MGVINNTNLNAYKMIHPLMYMGQFMLTSTGLVLLDVNSTTFEVSLASLISPLPPNSNYKIALTYASFDIFYVKNSPYIYKCGYCMGQTIFNYQNCEAYNCSDPNCLYCPINSVTCGTCRSGYVRNESLLCEVVLSKEQTNYSIISSTL